MNSWAVDCCCCGICAHTHRLLTEYSVLLSLGIIYIYSVKSFQDSQIDLRVTVACRIGVRFLHTQIFLRTDIAVKLTWHFMVWPKRRDGSKAGLPRKWTENRLWAVGHGKGNHNWERHATTNCILTFRLLVLFPLSSSNTNFQSRTGHVPRRGAM